MLKKKNWKVILSANYKRKQKTGYTLGGGYILGIHCTVYSRRFALTQCYYWCILIEVIQYVSVCVTFSTIFLKKEIITQNDIETTKLTAVMIKQNNSYNELRVFLIGAIRLWCREAMHTVYSSGAVRKWGSDAVNMYVMQCGSGAVRHWCKYV